jgi:NAD(P)-dependent dehydrogenase (short-subunit alcohol dehydrogenase family)
MISNAVQDLGGRAILVTGSSRGIGHAIATELASRGACVAVHGRDPDLAGRVAAELGPGNVGLAADLTSEEEVKRLVAAAKSALGGLDGLVNNAGVAQADPTVELSSERWADVLALNLTAPFLCSREAARVMLEGEGGAIVNILSIAAFTGLPGRVAYSATKAGLLGMTRTLALEWGSRIRVNAVAPGYVGTKPLEELATAGKVDLEAIERRVPAGRLGERAEVAAAVGFLLSDAAAYITGESLAVDGGWLVNGSA